MNQIFASFQTLSNKKQLLLMGPNNTGNYLRMLSSSNIWYLILLFFSEEITSTTITTPSEYTMIRSQAIRPPTVRENMVSNSAGKNIRNVYIFWHSHSECGQEHWERLYILTQSLRMWARTLGTSVKSDTVTQSVDTGQ